LNDTTNPYNSGTSVIWEGPLHVEGGIVAIPNRAEEGSANYNYYYESEFMVYQ